jgi:hypothetical protein
MMIDRAVAAFVLGKMEWHEVSGHRHITPVLFSENTVQSSITRK